MLALLQHAGELEHQNGRLRSKVRFSTLGEQLFAHSGFPTDASDSVFLGPDTYRFVAALRHVMADLQPEKSLIIVDVRAGSGAGGSARLLSSGRDQ
jgi:hypothetical protein